MATLTAPPFANPSSIVLLDERTSQMTEEAFWQFCQQNRHLRIEREADHTISIMPPTGYEPSFRSGEPFRQLANWAIDRPGMACDSSGGFTLPDGAVRSPDAAWVSPGRDATVTGEARNRFAPLCPDFIIEVVSPSDSLPVSHRKMATWISNGARLGFLIDPATETAWVYRPGAEPANVQGFDQTLSGEDVLPGFILELRRLRRQ